MAHTLSTCTFCGAGCGVYLESKENEIIGVYPSMSHPVNQGRICVRGWHLHEVASSPDRVKQPLLRKNGHFHEVSWAEALNFIATRLKEIRSHAGPDALGFLNSPRCSNEESYLLQKLARAVVGTNNVDHGAGVYCNNSIQVLLQTLGIAASTNSIQELAHSNVILVDGVDLARQLPTVAGVVLRAGLSGAELIVIDSRRHRLAESADLFLQIKPGSESALYTGMAKVIVDRGLMPLTFLHAYCPEYERFLWAVREYDLLSAAEQCGVGAELIEAAALAYARAERAAILYSTGIASRGSEAVGSLVNLALLSGQIGKPGAGIFALTEQNNLQGVGDMGMLPDRLPGYSSVTEAAARAPLEALWESQVPAAPGCGARQILEDRAGGKIRGVWLCRYDPVSTAVVGDAANALAGCEMVVVQHLFLTETAKLAHVILPTTAYGEERVTFTNTERRIQIAEHVIQAPGNCSPAWQQIMQTANLLGANWSYQSSAGVMEEICQAVPFYSGASYSNLAREYGRQWPCTKDQPLGTPYLFADPASRQFHFAPVVLERRHCPESTAYPLTLVFGNSLYYWHHNVLIQHSETLKREYGVLLLDYPDGFAEINTDDARELQIRDGDLIRICAASGSTVTQARVTPEVRRGAVFVPYFVREVGQRIRAASEGDAGTVPVRISKEPS